MAASEGCSSWSRPFPERIPPVSRSRGTDTDADFHSISLLVTGSHACPKLRTSPVRLLSSVRVVASQLPRGIRWKRKPACLSGLRTASQLVLPSLVPAHTPASKGGVRFRSFPGFCRATRLASWGLPTWRNGWQLSPAARSAAPRPPIFHPPTCRCHPEVVVSPVLFVFLGFVALVLRSSLTLCHSFAGILVRSETNLTH